jgi:hypothetical protein
VTEDTLMLTLVDAGCTNSGSACPLDITGSLNLDGVATPETKTEGNFDGVGWSFPAGQLPAPGIAVLGGQAYRIPSTAGTTANFVAPTSALTVPTAGTFSQLSLLASARNGDAKDVPVTLHYTNGDISTTISVSDWAAGSPRFGETDPRPHHRTGRDEQRLRDRRALRAPVGRHRPNRPGAGARLGELWAECPARRDVHQRSPPLTKGVLATAVVGGRSAARESGSPVGPARECCDSRARKPRTPSATTNA